MYTAITIRDRFDLDQSITVYPGQRAGSIASDLNTFFSNPDKDTERAINQLATFISKGKTDSRKFSELGLDDLLGVDIFADDVVPAAA